MKKIILLLFTIIIRFSAVANSSVFIDDFKYNLQIDSLDTVIFNISQAMISGNIIQCPVSILSDDTVYSLDFSLKYNMLNLSYDSVSDLTNYLQAFSFYNTTDSTLRFTSSSLQRLGNDTPLVEIRFSMLSPQLNDSDVNTVKAYLNGTACNIKFADYLTSGVTNSKEQDNLRLIVFPNPANTNIFVESSENVALQLLDPQGREMIKGWKINAGQLKEVNIKGLPVGIYILKISNGQTSTSRKIIVNK